MAATLNVPVVGVETIDGYDIRFFRRPGATALWMTLVGQSAIDDVDLGTVVDLHTDEPQERIFQRCSLWATPTRRIQIRECAARLYRKDEARRAGA